jgi:hypothetical protein
MFPAEALAVKYVVGGCKDHIESLEFWDGMEHEIKRNGRVARLGDLKARHPIVLV